MKTAAGSAQRAHGDASMREERDDAIKANIDALRGVSETLLITLAGRARGTEDAGVAGFADPKSLEICVKYDVDLERYAGHRPTMLGVVHRGA